MNYHQFNPSTDTLEVGTKIRLAGREGELMNWLIAKAGFKKLWGIKWSTGYNIESHLLDLESFTFEIADKPAKPLTIDKRVKDRLLKILTDTMWGMEIKPANIEEARAFLNSLEET